MDKKKGRQLSVRPSQSKGWIKKNHQSQRERAPIRIQQFQKKKKKITQKFLILYLNCMAHKKQIAQVLGWGGEGSERKKSTKLTAMGVVNG